MESEEEKAQKDLYIFGLSGRKNQIVVPTDAQTALVTLIKGSLKQPEEKGYELAPPVRVECTPNTLEAGTATLFSQKPARCIFQCSLIDPLSNNVISSQHYSDERDFSIGDTSSRCVSRGIGSTTLYDLMNSGLSKLGNNASIPVPKSDSKGDNYISGTLIFVDGNLIMNEDVKRTVYFSIRYGGMSIFDMWHFSMLTLPNAVQKAAQKNNLFSNTPENAYIISLGVIKLDYFEQGIFSSGHVEFTVEATLKKNNKEIARFIYPSGKVQLTEQKVALEKCADHILSTVQTLALKL